MKRLVTVVVSLIALTGAVLGQGGLTQEQAAEYQRTFSRGITDLQSGRHEEGIQAFQRCLELVPEEPSCAYNIACGYSLKGEVDAAFEWLEKSVDYGFGITRDNVDLARTDTDLTNLRSDSRMAGVLARMDAALKVQEENKKRAEAYAKDPVVYVPPSAPPEGEETGVLVVLHDAGRTKDTIAKGPWKRVADELGLVLIAPSGKQLVGRTPEEGMAWIDAPESYVERYWTYERPVQDAVTAFKKSRKVDSKRVFLAGEGEGALLAFNIAVSGPGLYKGVVLRNGIFAPQLAAAKGANAAKMGLRTRILLDDVPELRAISGELEKLLVSWQMNHELTLRPAVTDEDAIVAELSAAVRALEPEKPGVEAAEAGAATGGH